MREVLKDKVDEVLVDIGGLLRVGVLTLIRWDFRETEELYEALAAIESNIDIRDRIEKCLSLFEGGCLLRFHKHFITGLDVTHDEEIPESDVRAFSNELEVLFELREPNLVQFQLFHLYNNAGMHWTA